MKLYIAVELLLLVVGIKEAQSACGPEAVKVVSGDSYDQRFVVENLLTQDAKETPDAPDVTTKTNYCHYRHIDTQRDKSIKQKVHLILHICICFR